MNNNIQTVLFSTCKKSYHSTFGFSFIAIHITIAQWSASTLHL
jgi:hypothetical protein